MKTKNTTKYEFIRPNCVNCTRQGGTICEVTSPNYLDGVILQAKYKKFGWFQRLRSEDVFHSLLIFTNKNKLILKIIKELIHWDNCN